MMEEALRGWLKARPPLVQLVGSRIDWDERSQGETLPAVVLWLISARPTINQASAGPWRRDRVQFDCLGRTHLAARNVADIIAANASDGGLHGLRADYGGIRARSFVIDRDSDKDTDSVGTVHRARVDVDLWWKKQGD